MSTATFQNKKLVLTSYPKGMVKDSDFKLENIPCPSKVTDQQVIVRLLHLSVDPYMRIRLNETPPKGYFGPFPLNKPINGGTISRVMKVGSKLKDQYKEGDMVLGDLPWELEQTVDVEEGKLTKIENKSEIPLSYFLGTVGMPGLTAYFGLIEIAEPKEGETILVSAASGAVGSVVGQLGKIVGCRVVGISGSDNVKELLDNGFDEVINYKKFNNNAEELKKAIEKACPKGVDIYYDNVGGFILDAATLALNNRGRITFCGAISSYNAEEPETGLRLSTLHVVRELRTQGFIVYSYSDKFPEATEKLTQWIKEGKIKVFETKFQGIESIPKALQSLFTGEKIGKVIVDLCENKAM